MWTKEKAVKTCCKARIEAKSSSNWWTKPASCVQNTRKAAELRIEPEKPSPSSSERSQSAKKISQPSPAEMSVARAIAATAVPTRCCRRWRASDTSVMNESRDVRALERVSKWLCREKKNREGA